MKTIQFTFLFLQLFNLAVFSQSGILAGGAHVAQIGGCTENRVRLEISIFTKPGFDDQERESIQVDWGDGLTETVGRVSQPGNLPNNFAWHVYLSEHTYASPGQYSILATDCCLATDFVNLKNGGPVSFETRVNVQIFNGQFQGCNSTPKLMQMPVDIGLEKIPFFFNGQFFDSDGDSLSFQLADPVPELNYFFPNEISPGPGNQFSMDPKSGVINWNTPNKSGKYLVGLKVREHRFGVLSGENFYWLMFEIKNLDIFILPNPVSGVLTIQMFPEAGNQDFNLIIFNDLGQLILKESGSFFNSRHSINVSDFANGIYFLRLECLGKQWTKKFVKT